MASGSDDGTAQVMDIRNGRQIAIVPVGSPVEAAGFTTTDALVLVSVDGTIRTVDLANKAGFEQVRSGSGRIVDISPAGKYFATWLPAPGNSHELVINDRSGRRLWSLPVRSDTFAATASFGFSIDDKYFTVVDPQAGVTMYEAFGGAMVSKEEGTAQSAVAVISGDGRTVVWAVGNTLKILRLSLESGHVGAVRDLPPIGRGIGRIAVLALSPDGTLLAAAGEGGSGARTGISVFDVNANKWLASTDDEVHVELAAFSDDGRHLLTLSENRLMLFKMPGGVRAWPANTALGIKDVAHIGFSHDGHMIAAVGEDVSNSTMAMELIDAADGKALASTRYPANDKMDGIRHALAFEPDFLAIADGISIARLPRTRDALVTLACSVSRAGIPPDEWKNVDMPLPATCRGQSRK